MYPLRRDSDFSFLIGKEICQVAIGRYDLQLNWGSGGISIWNEFIYRRAGVADDVVWSDDNPEIAARTVPLLYASITSATCSERGSLELSFSNGDQLELLEDARYESFSIRDENRPEIIV